MSGLHDLINIMYDYALRNDNVSVNQLKNFAVTINERRYTYLPDTQEMISNIINNLVLSVSKGFSGNREEYLEKIKNDTRIIYFLSKTREVE